MEQNMPVKRPAGSCNVVIPSKPCNCGGKWIRVTDARYPFTVVKCGDCESLPVFFEIRKIIDGHMVEFRFNAKGVKMKTLDDILKTSLEIEADVAAGTFTKTKYYKKKSHVGAISETIEDFITDNIFPRWKKLHMTLDDKIWIEDYLQPFMADVGIFVVSEVHLRDFINTFRLKGEDKERAERLFQVITREIKL